MYCILCSAWMDAEPIALKHLYKNLRNKNGIYLIKIIAVLLVTYATKFPALHILTKQYVNKEILNFAPLIIQFCYTNFLGRNLHWRFKYPFFVQSNYSGFFHCILWLGFCTSFVFTWFLNYRYVSFFYTSSFLSFFSLRITFTAIVIISIFSGFSTQTATRLNYEGMIWRHD